MSSQLQSPVRRARSLKYDQEDARAASADRTEGQRPSVRRRLARGLAPLVRRGSGRWSRLRAAK